MPVESFYSWALKPYLWSVPQVEHTSFLPSRDMGGDEGKVERMAKRHDLIILGGGAAALRAAIRADRNGAEALMIDGGTIGGTCVDVGCGPSQRALALASQF